MAGQSFWRVMLGINLLPGGLVIPQLHDVIEVPSVIVAAHVQDVNEAGMLPRDGGELLDAAELAFERPGVMELVAINNFDGVESANGIARQPNVAVSATANLTAYSVIGN